MSRSRYYPGPRGRHWEDERRAALDAHHRAAILDGVETYFDLRDRWARVRYVGIRIPVEHPGRARAPRRIRRVARAHRAAERRRIRESLFILRAGAPAKGLCFSCGRVFVNLDEFHVHTCVCA